MRDFKQQFQTYSDELKSTRCPYSDAELDREIRSVIWNITPNENTKTPSRHRLWPAAAAIAAAIIIPAAILMKGGTPSRTNPISAHSSNVTKE